MKVHVKKQELANNKVVVDPSLDQYAAMQYPPEKMEQLKKNLPAVKKSIARMRAQRKQF